MFGGFGFPPEFFFQLPRVIPPKRMPELIERPRTELIVTVDLDEEVEELSPRGRKRGARAYNDENASEFDRSVEAGLRRLKEGMPVPRELSILPHDDVHVFLRTDGETLLFDFSVHKVFEDSPQTFYKCISQFSPEDEEKDALIDKSPCYIDRKRRFALQFLMLAWKEFYIRTFPELDLPGDYIMSVRLAGLLGLREAVIEQMEKLLKIPTNEVIMKNQLSIMRRMVRFLQAARDRNPSSEGAYDFEKHGPILMRTYLPFVAMLRFLCDGANADPEDVRIVVGETRTSSMAIRNRSTLGPRSLSGVHSKSKSKF